MLLSDSVKKHIFDAVEAVNPPASGEVLVNLRFSFSKGGYRGFEIETATTANYSAEDAPMK